MKRLTSDSERERIKKIAAATFDAIASFDSPLRKAIEGLDAFTSRRVEEAIQEAVQSSRAAECQRCKDSKEALEMAEAELDDLRDELDEMRKEASK